MAYQVLHEDDQKFHVKHPDGSEFKVAKKGLSPTALKKIQSMKVQKFADGGTALKADEAFSIPTDQSGQPTNIVANAPTATPPIDWDVLNQQQQAANAFTGDLGSPITARTVNLGATPQAAPADQQPQPIQDQSVSSQAPQASQPVSTATNMGAGMPTTADLNKLTNQIGGAEIGSGNALAKGYNQQADIYQQQVEQQQAAATDFQNRLAKLDGEHQQLVQAVQDGHVDPNRLYKNMSTGSKIGSAISLILGGMGGGASGHNAAMDVMQNAINRDIESQKVDLGKTQTLLGENLKQYGNLYAAEAATRLQSAAIIQGQMNKIAAQTNSPMAQLAAQKAAAQIKLSVFPLQQQLAQHQMAMSMLNQSNNTQDPASRIRALSMAGVMSDKDKEQALKELGSASELEKLRAGVEGSAKDIQTRVLNGTFNQSARDSDKNTYGGILAKLAEGRFNLDESKQQMDALLPNGSDLLHPGNAALKAQHRQEFFDSLKTTPTLDQYQIKVPSVAGSNPLEGKISVNKNTGQRLIMKNGSWVPYK